MRPADFKAIAILALLAFPACSASSEPEPDLPHLVIAGDSTAADYPPERAPQIGWGQTLAYFMASPAQLDNRAVNGRSLRSFADEGKWNALLDTLKAGDVVLISFGHNDSRDDAPERYADPRTDYPALLENYVVDVREKDAIPVIVSSAPRRLWEGPAMVETHGLYLQAAETVAEELDVPFVDLARHGLAYFEGIGREASKQDYLWHDAGDGHPRFPDGVEDNTHFSELGACGMAYVLAQEFADHPSLSGFIDTAKLSAAEADNDTRPAPVLDCTKATRDAR
ncbi:rhamnogalacturonan acetylesterase [Henriciella sp.]|uniref:rhamnogalacturonan acetylesterase n=1 Tax=Henriciella sp. TaxID=1968823 RepID=UPI003C729749